MIRLEEGFSTQNLLLGAAACDGNGHVYLALGANDPTLPTADFWELTIVG